MDNAVARCISVPEINSILSNLSWAVTFQKITVFYYQKALLVTEKTIISYWKSPKQSLIADVNVHVLKCSIYLILLNSNQQQHWFDKSYDGARKLRNSSWVLWGAMEYWKYRRNSYYYLILIFRYWFSVT